MRAWIERYGVPLTLYVDWKNLYKRAATPKERLCGEEPITQFGRMCAKLGIELIAASSPQAKGRIERMHGVPEDRLVKKLRRRGIGTHPAADLYVQREYLPEHNRRFARVAAKPEDYHRRALRAAELDRIFRLEQERVAGGRRSGALGQSLFPARSAGWGAGDTKQSAGVRRAAGESVD